MEVPTLVITFDEGALAVMEVQLPGVANGIPVFLLLLRCEVAFVRGDGQDVGGAVGDPDAGTGQSYLHNRTSKVAGVVQHILILGGDLTVSGVVVSAEVGASAATAK